MEYRTLGKTGLSVSEVSLGGEWLEGKTEEEVKAIINTALDLGINYIDIFMPDPAEHIEVKSPAHPEILHMKDGDQRKNE